MTEQIETEVTETVLDPIEVKKPTVDYTAPTIDYDLTELESNVAEIQKRYGELIVSDDQVKDIKKVMADLNKAKKALDDYKKEIKTAINEPYKKFEDDIKAIMSTINTVRSKLDKQIKEFDNAKKEEKKGKIVDFFNGLDNPLEIPFAKFFEGWMLNEATSFKKCKETITKKLNKINDGYAVIKMVNVLYPQMLMDIFKETLDSTKALAEYNEKEKTMLEYENTKKAQEQPKKEEEPKPVEEPKPKEEPKLVEEDSIEDFLNYVDSMKEEVSPAIQVISKSTGMTTEEVKNAKVVKTITIAGDMETVVTAIAHLRTMRLIVEEIN